MTPAISLWQLKWKQRPAAVDWQRMREWDEVRHKIICRYSRHSHVSRLIDSVRRPFTVNLFPLRVLRKQERMKLMKSHHLEWPLLYFAFYYFLLLVWNVCIFITGSSYYQATVLSFLLVIFCSCPPLMWQHWEIMWLLCSVWHGTNNWSPLSSAVFFPVCSTITVEMMLLTIIRCIQPNVVKVFKKKKRKKKKHPVISHDVAFLKEIFDVWLPLSEAQIQLFQLFRFLYSSDQQGRASGGWSCWLSAAASGFPAPLPSRRSIVPSQRLSSCFFRRIFGTCWKRGRITSTGCCLRTSWTLHAITTRFTWLHAAFVTFPVSLSPCFG